MPSIYAALWSRPSTGSATNAGRTVAQGFDQLSKAMDLAVKRMGEAWVELPEVERQPRLKGLFVAPEYFFANPGMGKWDSCLGDFRSRPIEQSDKELLVADLIALSKRHPNYLIVPGSVAWRKPLDRSGPSRFQKDSEGNRTGVEKTTSRRDKAAGIVGAPGANQGMGGQLLQSSPFYKAVIDAINGKKKGSPPVPFKYDLEDAFDDNIADGMTTQEAIDDVVDTVMEPKYSKALIAWAGLSPNSMAVIPKKRAKVAAITSGTATHMMRNTAFVLHGGKVVFKYNKRGDFHECIGDGETVFTPGEGLGKTNSIQGVTFGLEICLDHALGILHTGIGSGTPPDVHIVLSDSVDNDDKNMAAISYFVHASTSSTATGVWAAPSWSPANRAKLNEEDPASGGLIKYWKLKI